MVRVVECHDGVCKFHCRRLPQQYLLQIYLQTLQIFGANIATLANQMSPRLRIGKTSPKNKIMEEKQFSDTAIPDPDERLGEGLL